MHNYCLNQILEFLFLALNVFEILASYCQDQHRIADRISRSFSYGYYMKVRSGVGTLPEQRVAASTLRRYSFVLRLAIAQADTSPPCPYPSDRPPPDATMKRVGAPSAWLNPLYLDKK